MLIMLCFLIKMQINSRELKHQKNLDILSSTINEFVYFYYFLIVTHQLLANIFTFKLHANKKLAKKKVKNLLLIIFIYY